MSHGEFSCPSGVDCQVPSGCHIVVEERTHAARFIHNNNILVYDAPVCVCVFLGAVPFFSRRLDQLSVALCSKVRWRPSAADDRGGFGIVRLTFSFLLSYCYYTIC